jgi:hypothetical protein
VAVGLPGGVPKNVAFDAQTGEVTFLYEDREQPAPIRIGALGALLISYCVRAGIRIPRQFKRDVRIDRDAVVLIFSTNYLAAPAALVPDSARAPNLPRAAMEWAKGPM